MKKIKLYSVFVGFTIIFSLVSTIFSQTKWGIPDLEINIPVKMSYGNFDNIPPSGHSSDSIVNRSISVNAYYYYQLKLETFSQNDNIIDLKFYDSNQPWNN